SCCISPWADPATNRSGKTFNRPTKGSGVRLNSLIDTSRLWIPIRKDKKIPLHDHIALHFDSKDVGLLKPRIRRTSRTACRQFELHVRKANVVRQSQLDHITIKEFSIAPKPRINRPNPQRQTLERELSPDIVENHPATVFFQAISEPSSAFFVLLLATPEIAVLNRATNFINADITGKVN